MPSTPRQTKPRKTDATYERLRDLIVSLELEPGTPIDERALMERLESGRTPLREAIQRLVHEDLIVLAPRRGRWVSPLSLIDLQQMIEARRLVEPAVNRLAARRITPEQVCVIREEIVHAEELSAAGDRIGCVFHDKRFHAKLALASGNRHLAQMVEQTIQKLIRYWYVSFVRGSALPPVFTHHRRMLEVIASGDADEAERVTHEHIDILLARLKSLVGEPEEASSALPGPYHVSPNGAALASEELGGISR